MNVPAVGTSAAAPRNASPLASNTMDYQAFLKLLVAEMSNQDPLNPTSSADYVAQFASFSSVEQAIQTNKKLDSMMTVSALTQANSLIGRTATSGDGTISGIVQAVRVADDEVQAILANGKVLALGSGTVVE